MSSGKECAEILAKQIIDVERGVREITPVGRSVLKEERRRKLEPLLEQTSVLPEWRALVMAETVLLYPSGFPKKDVPDLVDIFYGIRTEEKNFGICDPETVESAQREVLELFYPTIIDRMTGIGPKIRQPLSLAQLERLATDLKIFRH